MKKRWYVILCLVWSIILCGCGSQIKDEDEMYIYYINAEGNALVSDVQPMMSVEEALNMLLEPTEKGILVPQEVILEGYELSGNKLIIQFSDEYADLKKSIEVLFRAAVVQTMVQIEGINFVSFYVENQPLTDTDGNPIGLMRAEDFVSNVGYTSEAYQTTELRLFFADTEGMKLHLVKKNEVHYNINTSMEKLIVEQLMKGTGVNGASSTIPKTTKLLGVSVKDGICYVNFDEKFATEGYDQNPEVTIYSIVNSIIENANISKVQILIEGSSDVLYKGTVDLSRPLEWNASLLEEQE